MLPTGKYSVPVERRKEQDLVATSHLHAITIDFHHTEWWSELYSSVVLVVCIRKAIFIKAKSPLNMLHIRIADSPPPLVHSDMRGL
jgi:hypothetical protein